MEGEEGVERLAGGWRRERRRSRKISRRREKRKEQEQGKDRRGSPSQAEKALQTGRRQSGLTLYLGIIWPQVDSGIREGKDQTLASGSG